VDVVGGGRWAVHQPQATTNRVWWRARPVAQRTQHTNYCDTMHGNWRLRRAGGRWEGSTVSTVAATLADGRGRRAHPPPPPARARARCYSREMTPRAAAEHRNDRTCDAAATARLHRRCMSSALNLMVRALRMPSTGAAAGGVSAGVQFQ
jgi:hypothetical protein